MSKETKIAIFSVLIISILSLVLIFLGNSMIKIRTIATTNQSKSVDLVLLDRTYREQARQIINSYSDSELVLSIDRVNQLKTQLLALVVPGKFRDLHYSLVSAMDKMINYLQTGSNQDKVDSQQLVSQAKIDYSWLN